MLLLLLASVGSHAAPSEQPNFVIMMADDMGYGDWSRTGSPAMTPELDEMSRSQHAVWFQRVSAAISQTFTSSPTRASVMTGRTPARTCIWGVEQHILCHAGASDCIEGEYSLANATQDKGGYVSGFYGKWHLGSLSDRGVGSPDCYEKPANRTCVFGYWEKNGGCCFGIDDKLDISMPLNFGFDEFVATPECAASATTNCGCFFHPSPHNDTPCETGHYGSGVGGQGFLECMQYYNGSIARESGAMSIEPLDYVTPVNDEDFLVSHATTEGKPFLAVIFFHGAHIPYVASPATRARYATKISPATGKLMDTNEQDYWGTITQISAAVGRVRTLLAQHGVADRTWVSLTADNGPEVNPAGGQGTGNFANPGLTQGVREIGLVEFPPAVKANRVEKQFPISTMDLMATVLDVLGLESHNKRSLDGISL
eukprot:gene10916-9748_t